MSEYLVTPILSHYNFLEELCSDVSNALSLDLSDKNKHEQFKVSLFLNFNNFLVDSILLLPEEKGKELFEKMMPFIESGDEEETIKILNSIPEFLQKVRSDFIDIIKKTNK